MIHTCSRIHIDDGEQPKKVKRHRCECREGDRFFCAGCLLACFFTRLVFGLLYGVDDGGSSVVVGVGDFFVDLTLARCHFFSCRCVPSVCGFEHWKWRQW